MQQRLLAGLAGMLLLAACRKDDLVECTPTTKTTTTAVTPPSSPVPTTATSNLTLAEFTRRNGARSQYFRLLPGQATTLTTSAGASLAFSANYFILPPGTLPTDTAQVRVRELYTVVDMVLADMPTVAYSTQNILLSGGEFSIQVRSRQGTRLVASASAPMLLQSPMPNPQDTSPQRLWQQPYVQLPSTSPSTLTPNYLSGSWQTAATYPAVQLKPPFYQSAIPLDSLSWWNIDHIWPAYAGTTLVPLVIATPAAAYAETRVYLRPAGANGLARLTSPASPYTQWAATMPLGAAMQAVVLQSINGQLYFGTQLFTVQSGLTVTPVLTAVSEADAVRLIRQL